MHVDQTLRPAAGPDVLPLRYGLNPHQRHAVARFGGAGRPFTVLNGAASYLNLLDALTGWQVARDGRAVLGRPVAVSVKHVGPNGVGTDVPLSPAERAAYRAPDELSPIALAYVRARGTDRVAAYGDFIALSDPADESFARAIRAEATNGVIAPDFTGAAAEILRRKRNGTFLVLRADPGYDPPEVEVRDVFGLSLRQDRNRARVTADQFAGSGTRRGQPTGPAVVDLLLATLAVRYAQSNAIVLAYRGQTVGVGAGQPSRIRATQLAARRAAEWWLTQHPAVRDLPGAGLSRHGLDTAIAEFLAWHELHPAARDRLRRMDIRWPTPLDGPARTAWLSELHSLALASDGPIPFPDSLHASAGVGVRYVAQPGGARRDAEVLAAANHHDMVMVEFGLRLFQH